MADDSTDQVQDDYSGEPPRSSKPYLDAIKESEKAFDTYQTKADNIDRLYADLERQAKVSRDREFAMFWANIEVLKPSVYSRPPVPVVVPRFKDRRPVPRQASEILERACIVGFECEDIDQVMRLVRDDLVVQARGVPWLRYETKDGEYATERVCIEHADRRDFLHELQRSWKDVGWVAKRSWLDKDAMKKRFAPKSEDAYLQAEYNVRKEDKNNGAADSEAQAGVWEIWHKRENKVIWVTPGVDVVLDEDKPHLTLEGFFPCPRPAYGTVQRRSLVPVPDMLFYKDQLEEINELTARIAALSEAVKVRGFYPAGSGEIGDAIEAAIKANTNNQIMIPISNWAAFGNAGAKDMIVWLPIDMIATTITQLVALRKELIDDVYQITGISDIMRGSTEASETLGAQQLKSQYGSIRIRDRQAELVRVARDIARLAAEIMAENFSAKTLLDMSQVDIPTEADLKEQEQQIIAAAQGQIQQAKANPQVAAQLQQNPQAGKQMLDQLEQQTQAQIAKLQQTPTIEKVMALLRAQRLRPFVLDIETDSTIQPDEDAQKQRATEFITAVGGFLNQAAQLVQQVPQAAPLMSDTLKYVASQFRAGRELEGSIDEFADQMKQMGAQQKGPSPEQVKAEADAQATQADAAEKTANAQKTTLEAQTKAANEEQARQIRAQEAADASRARDAEIANKTRLTDLQMTQMRQKHSLDMDIGAQQLLKAHIEVERIKADAMQPEAAPEKNSPAESIGFKDLPPEGQAQMAAQAGITLSTDTLRAHADEQAAQQLAAKQAAKPKAKEPA